MNKTWWETAREKDFWFNKENPESKYIWEYWDDYHYGTLDIDMDMWSAWFFGDDMYDQSGMSHGQNPKCGVESWVSATIDCEHFDNIDYQDVCYIMYSNNPCNMGDMTCTMPHYDMQGIWQYTDCSGAMTNREQWMKIRDSPVWHDMTVSDQLPYIHEYWDNYHGIQRQDWWYDAWAMSSQSPYADYATWQCEDRSCEWVDCAADELMIDGRDCWKEVCTGCNSQVCQLWHWDVSTSEWDTEECHQGDMAMVGGYAQQASAFNGTAGMMAEDLCDDYECIQALGEWAAMTVSNSSDGRDSMNSILANDRAQEYAEQALSDAGYAFDMDTEPFEVALEVESVGQIENTMNAMDADAVDDEENWYGDALDAFWNGFTGN